jgi:hypothetical protein
MSHKKKATKPTISSADEAVEKIECEIYGFEWNQETDMNMNKIRNLVRKIWEDAYQSGWSDAKSDAAVEAAEAEWFNG